MIKKVSVPMYETADGQQFRSAAKAQLHEWLITPAEVTPVNVRYQGPSRDQHTNVWSWTCGRCKTAAGQHVDTMFSHYSLACMHCSAVNTFDFNKYIDELLAKRAAESAATVSA
jgi:hypothetical protein